MLRRTLFTLHMIAGLGAALFVVVLGLTGSIMGASWSITLEVRENHRVISQGVYRRIRHPMYSALFLYSVGQALALPN